MNCGQNLALQSSVVYLTIYPALVGQYPRRLICVWKNKTPCTPYTPQTRSVTALGLSRLIGPPCTTASLLGLDYPTFTATYRATMALVLPPFVLSPRVLLAI